MPLFLRMPPWCDLTLYDVAARNVMQGGAHYRDVFDTNLPGFVWLLVLVRRAFGPSVEAVRAVDLVVVAGVVALLARFARRAGATPAGVAWMAAGAAFFYPFTSEFNHAQRDVWMLVPALAATLLRLRRAESGRRGFWPAALEGAVWGGAVWIKPHAVFPAAAVWLASARRVAGGGSVRPDLLGNLAGGLAAGLAGVDWIVATGGGPAFEDVLKKWNPEYTRHMFELLPHRLTVELSYFPPLNLFLPVGALLAAVNLADARRPGGPGPVARRRPRLVRWVVRVWAAAGRFFRRLSGRLSVPAETDEARFARGVLAALFLAWVLQAMLLQRQFHYVHVPEILLLLAVAAANRWALVPLALAHAVVAGGLWLAADRHRPLELWLHDNSPSWSGELTFFPRHPLFMPARVRQWPACFRTDLSDRDYRRRMNDVALFAGTFASVDPVEIGEVADELRRLGAAEGEVLCWHDTPHAVYLELGHRPPFRFMHVNTGFIGLEAYERMKIELVKLLATHRPPIRYVVSDLARAYAAAPPRFKSRMGEAGPDLLPPTMPANHRATFPFDRPAVFRSGGGHGRYLIHVYDPAHPFGEFDDCSVADWPDE